MTPRRGLFTEVPRSGILRSSDARYWMIRSSGSEQTAVALAWAIG
jgi:hypothetical protein